MTPFETIVVSAVIGAIFGAGGTLATTYWIDASRRRRRARELCAALWEELHAAIFWHSKQPNFAGFSSQTFDTLFADVGASLPEDLARDIMRYHWRMKYLASQKALYGLSGVHPKLLAEAEQLRDNILQSLDDLRFAKGYVTWTARELNAGEIPADVLAEWNRAPVKGTITSRELP